MVFDPDHFAKAVIHMQGDLWGAFMDWYSKSKSIGEFIDIAISLNKQFEQYFLDLQKGAQNP